MKYIVSEDFSKESDIEGLLKSSSKTLFYHSVKYHIFLREYLSCKHVYFLAYDNNELVACLPFLYKESDKGSVFNSLPYYGSNGSFISLDNLDLDKKKEVFSNLYDNFITFSNNKNVLSSTIVDSPLNTASITHEILGFEATDYRIGQITPLPEKSDNIDEGLLKLFDNPRPRNIKKANKSGVVVKEEHSLDALKFLFKVHKDNIDSINGISKTQDFFTAIPNHFSNDDYSVFIAYKDGEPISGLLLFYYNETVEYFTPATIHDYRNIQPSALIIFEAMKNAILRGFKYWNWGGTWESQKGVYDFKKKWGAKDFNYSYYTKIYSEEILSLPKQELSRLFSNFYTYNYNLFNLINDEKK